MNRIDHDRRIGVPAGHRCVVARARPARIVRWRAQGAGAKQAPIFEVDPLWPKPLPNHWVTGSTIGLSVDAQDNVWTIHRPNTVEDNFKAADIKVGDARGRDDEAQPGAPSARPAAGSGSIGKCCKVAPPVLVYDQAGNLVKSWGGPGPGLRLAGQQSRHHRRSQRQRLAGRQRREGHADPEVQRRRGVPVSAGQARRPQRQQRHRELLAAHEDLRRRGGQRDVHLATGTATAASSCSTPTPGKYKRHWGAYGNKPSDERDARVQPRRPAVEAVQHRALRDRLEGRPRLRVRSRERSHSGVPQGRDVREGSVHRRQHVPVRFRVGHDLLARSAADLHLRGERRRREDQHPAARARSRC